MSSPLSRKSKSNQVFRKASLAVLAIGLGAVCFHLSSSITIWRAAQEETHVTPFLLEVKSYTFEDNPEGELLNVRREARRSEGTKVVSGAVFGQVGLQAGETARKITYMDGRTVTLADSIAAKTTWPQRSTLQVAQMKSMLLNAPTNCVYPGETLLGYATVLGQHVAIVKQRPLPGVDDEESTSWRAPALACQELEYRVVAKQPDGSQKVLTRGKAVTLELGEPDPSLFDERTNYAEVKPSDMLRQLASRLGVTWDDHQKASAKIMDDIYLKGFATVTQ